jgi:hypothetical protein
MTVNVLMFISLTEHVLEPSNESDQSAESENSRLECEVCHHTYANKGNLTRHMRKHAATMLKCVICKKECYTNYDLQMHIKVQHRDLLFICDHEDCDKSYKTKSGLRTEGAQNYAYTDRAVFMSTL